MLRGVYWTAKALCRASCGLPACRPARQPRYASTSSVAASPAFHGPMLWVRSKIDSWFRVEGWGMRF